LFVLVFRPGVFPGHLPRVPAEFWDNVPGDYVPELRTKLAFAHVFAVHPILAGVRRALLGRYEGYVN